MSMANSEEKFDLLDPVVIFCLSLFTLWISSSIWKMLSKIRVLRAHLFNSTALPFYRWRKWGPKRQSDLPKVMQGLEPRTSELQSRILTIEQKIKILGHNHSLRNTSILIHCNDKIQWYLTWNGWYRSKWDNDCETFIQNLKALARWLTKTTGHLFMLIKN